MEPMKPIKSSLNELLSHTQDTSNVNAEDSKKDDKLEIPRECIVNMDIPSFTPAQWRATNIKPLRSSLEITSVPFDTVRDLKYKPETLVRQPKKENLRYPEQTDHSWQTTMHEPFFQSTF
jgi:hypothetical protein